MRKAPVNNHTVVGIGKEAESVRKGKDALIGVNSTGGANLKQLTINRQGNEKGALSVGQIESLSNGKF